MIILQQVMDRGLFLDPIDDKKHNIHDTLEEGYAKSRYHISTRKKDATLTGNIQIAKWSSKVEEAPEQFFFLDGSTTVVESLSNVRQATTSLLATSTKARVWSHGAL